jgi:hypothetical protein
VPLRSNEDHNLGEIWATMLNDMFWDMNEEFGMSSDLFNASQKQGNIVTIQLVIGALMIQPCNPTFVQARDAILQTDYNYYNGVHVCTIWKAFARRGMGANAMDDFQNDFTVPLECDGKGLVQRASIAFLSNYTNTVVGLLRKGAYVSVSYDLRRVSRCEIIEICHFMNQETQKCHRVDDEEGRGYVETALYLPEAGILNMYIRVRL